MIANLLAQLVADRLPGLETHQQIGERIGLTRDAMLRATPDLVDLGDALIEPGQLVIQLALDRAPFAVELLLVIVQLAVEGRELPRHLHERDVLGDDQPALGLAAPF